MPRYTPYFPLSPAAPTAVDWNINTRQLHPASNKFDPIKVEKLQYGHIAKTDRTMKAAFYNDPMNVYFREAPDARELKPWERKLLNTLDQAMLVRLLTNSLAYTVNGGDSFIIGMRAEAEAGSPTVLERLLHLYTVLVNRTVVAFNLFSEEQKRRMAEANAKSQLLVERHLGERIKDMIYVQLLATHPSCQGHGYATALMQTVIAIADSQSRALCLHTGTAENVKFYSSFGLVDIGHELLGNDNPSWGGEPMVLSLMVREPKTAGDKYSDRSQEV